MTAGTAEPGADRTIDELVQALYEVISFPEGGEPDWERMATLLSPHARFTRVTPEGTDHHDLAGFRAFAQEALDEGTYTSFHERETVRTVHRFGAMAHVLSAYETRQGPDSVEPFARGVNSIQVIHDDDGWRVLSLFWDEEHHHNPLDTTAVFENGVGR